jgi:hypothetical protein
MKLNSKTQVKYIEKVYKPRKGVELPSMSMYDIISGFIKGKWKLDVNKVRQYKRGTPQYDKAKTNLVGFQFQNDLPLWSVDLEKVGNPIPKESIFLDALSSGGRDRFLLVKIPYGSKESMEEYKKLQEHFNVESTKGQHSFDRLRYTTYDQSLDVNWNAKDLVIDVETTKSDSPPLWKTINPEDSLNHDTAHALFKHLRFSKPLDVVLKIMEGRNYEGSKSMATPKSRKKWYTKWEREFLKSKEDEPVIKQLAKLRQTKVSPPIKVDDEPDFYCTDDEQTAIMVQTTLGPFAPMKIKYFNEWLPVSTGTVLVGPPSSGKGTINKIVQPLIGVMNEIDNEMMDYFSEDYANVKNITIEKSRKLIPNISPIVDFSSSIASVVGSMSEFNRMLMYGTEIKQLISSSKSEHNSTMLSSILALIEGEGGAKMLKKNELYGKTKFYVKEPVFGLLSGGTPTTVMDYFANHVEDGLVSRLLFLVLRAGDLLTEKKFNIPNLSEIIDNDYMLKLAKGQVKIRNIEHDIKFENKLRQELHEEFKDRPFVYDCLRRGLRNCIKRAAVQMWYDGSSKSKIPDENIHWQLGIMRKSLAYIETFQDHERDRYGNNMLGEKLKMVKAIDAGKIVQVTHGVSLSRNQIEFIKELYSNGKSQSQIAREIGCSRRTIINVLGK